MSHRVYLIKEAREDLFNIYSYVAAHDSPEKADSLLKRLESVCKSLSRFPLRGHVPSELDRVGIYLYRELHYKPYRIIYQVIGQDVYIHGVLDGRRDLEDLLLYRLTRS